MVRCKLDAYFFKFVFRTYLYAARTKQVQSCEYCVAFKSLNILLSLFPHKKDPLATNSSSWQLASREPGKKKRRAFVNFVLLFLSHDFNYCFCFTATAEIEIKIRQLHFLF